MTGNLVRFRIEREHEFLLARFFGGLYDKVPALYVAAT